MARAVHATGGSFIRHRPPRVRDVGRTNWLPLRLRHQRFLGPGQPSLSQALRIGGSLSSTAAMTFAISHCTALTASPLSRFHAPISRS
jgi:hypothetical protein